MDPAIFTFQFRRGPASEWTTDNPTLRAGEPGFELDTGKMKMGNGYLAWNDLPYFPDVDDIVSGVASVDGHTGVVVLTSTYAALIHTHVQSDITGLVSALAGKASTVHTHIEADITGLVTDLAAKAALVHTHTEADIDNLVTDLAGKAASVHTHAQSDITGLVSALAGKAATVHTHAQSDITGLVSALAGKSDTGHVHAGTDITTGTIATARLSVGTGSTNVAAGDHTHTASDVGAAAASHTHAAGDTTSGTFAIGRIPTGTTSSTVSLGDHTHAAGDTTSGTFAIGRIPTGTSSSTVSLGDHNHLAGGYAALTDGSTINTDASLGTKFRVTLGGNRTLAKPTNAVNDQTLLFEFIQDGTGSRTITLDSSFVLGSGITAITLSTAANKRDFMGAIYNSTTDKFYVIAFEKGY